LSKSVSEKAAFSEPRQVSANPRPEFQSERFDRVAANVRDRIFD
jgi:hypothetical protein